MAIKLSTCLEHQTLRCHNCNQWLVLSLEEQTVEVEDIVLDCRLPVLRCLDCSHTYLPDRSVDAIRDASEEAIARGERTARIALTPPFVSHRFSLCGDVPLAYDPLDYFYLPGLVRPSRSGKLAPVFFSKDVLIQYYNHPEYSISFASDTYGTIHVNTDQIIAFGINRSGKVIMWLGDIHELPHKEKLYLASKNVPSDHDIGSEFYQGQIEVEFTEYSAEQQLTRNLSELADAVFEKYGIKLLRFDDEALSLIRSLRPPIYYSEKEFGDVIETLNKLVVERINTSALKRDLQTRLDNVQTEKIRSLGGLKTLEIWLQHRAGIRDASTKISCLFVVYDLRVIFKHLIPEATKVVTLETCCTRLGLSTRADNQAIYQALISQVATFCSNLRRLLGS